MSDRKNIFAIIGSASRNSANRRLVEKLRDLTADKFNLTIYDDLKNLPHFDPEISSGNPPDEVIAFRRTIEEANGILICTPEYIFSIPSGLKNAIEWCVSTTVFKDKPTGLITASAQGGKGHQELQLIMKTVMASFTAETALLIQGIKGKVDEDGEITDGKLAVDIKQFIGAYACLVENIAG